MTHDEWKESRRAGKGDSLEDAMRRTVNSAWNFPAACPICGSGDLSCPRNNSTWHCNGCGNVWDHY